MKLHCVNWFCGWFYPFEPNVQRPVVTRHRHGVFHMYAIALVAWLEVNLRLAHLGTESPLRSTHSGKFPPKHFIFYAHVICLFVVKVWPRHRVTPALYAQWEIFPITFHFWCICNLLIWDKKMTFTRFYDFFVNLFMNLSQQKIFSWIHVNGRNPNGNVQLSVAYLGQLPTLNSH